MSSPKVLSTVFDVVKDGLSVQGIRRSRAVATSVTPVDVEGPPEVDPEFKLPKRTSLATIILANCLCQISFFIIVSSSSAYAEHLGGSATFSGLVIGIPTVFSGLTLIPLMKWDQGLYKRPLHFACCFGLLGNILYGLAYRANFLYLILISRCVMGLAFTFFLYSKRYCSDARIVGIRRRTTLAVFLVMGQGIGFSVGPFIGGLLFKIGFGNAVFNGYTSPGWLMAVAWLVFWITGSIAFEDVPQMPERPSRVTDPVQDDIPLENRGDSTSSPRPPSSPRDNEESVQLNKQRWGVIACMCWYAMTCFFILGSWEANIPVYTTHAFGSSPFAAGNLIALGGISTFPFLFLNLWFAPRTQDRHILAYGSAVGMCGLVLMLAVLRSGKESFGTIFACWFLVALGFNVVSTVTLSLLSKQLPGSWNGKISMAIQYSNYAGRVTGAVWGGAGVRVGMMNYVALQIILVGIGGIMFMTLWKELKAKTG